MKILQVHNYYQLPGGEDRVVDLEKRLLESNKIVVNQFIKKNSDIRSVKDKLETAFFIKSSLRIKAEINNIFLDHKPDVVHVHNFFPLITPVVFEICHLHKIPVVFTLHNYRIMCPTATLMWKGSIVEQSITNGPWWALGEKVYHDSYLGTAALCYLIDKCKKENFWNRYVSKFICLTDFAKGKFVEFGIHSEKILVRPNFVIDPLQHELSLARKNNMVLYVGNLHDGKGIKILLESWKYVDQELQLRIVGDGPLREYVLQHAASNITYLGRVSSERVMKLMQESAFLVVPSRWYEGFPLVCAEAYSCGLPVLASRLGSLEEIVRRSGCGDLFDPSNPVDLANVINNYYRGRRAEQEAVLARQCYERYYTPEINYQLLMQIYQSAISGA